MVASRRLHALPTYVFAELEAEAAQWRAAGREVLDLGRADSDGAVPDAAVDALLRAVALGVYHRYAPFAGIPELRRAIAQWYADRHGVTLDPDREVLVTAGSKTPLFHAPLACCDPGDVVLVPDPSLPTYRIGAYLAGAETVTLPLPAASGHLPDLGAVPAAAARRTRLVFLNYPNNPTGAVAPPEFFAEAVAFARHHGALLCHDFSYGESGHGGYRPPSLLQAKGARDVAVEVLSWSDAFGVPGWRLGAVVGDAEAVGALARVEGHAAAGVFPAVQRAGSILLDTLGRSNFLADKGEAYRLRRDRMLAALAAAGWPTRTPRATPFLWIPCRSGTSSRQEAAWILERTGVLLTPGTGFGAGGEGFLRLSLAAAEPVLTEAAERLRRLGQTDQPEAGAAALNPPGREHLPQALRGSL